MKYGLPTWILPALLLLAPAASAQPVRLSLDDALARAEAQNYTLRRAAADEAVAAAAFRRTRAVFLPQLSVSETFVSTTDPLAAFGFKLKQEAVTAADFDPARLNDPDRIENAATVAEVRQPLFNADGFYDRRAARAQADAAGLARERTAHAVAFQVKQQYYALALAARQVDVLDAALAAARANAAQAQDLFDQGLVNRADLLAAQVRASDVERQRRAAANARQNAADELAYLLGMAPGTELVPADTLAAVPVMLPDALDPDAVAARRSDLRALAAQADAAALNARARKAAFLPSLNAFGTYEWNDDAPFGTQAENWTVGAALTWTPFAGFDRIGAVQQARAERRRAELAYDDQVQRTAVDLAAARRAVEEALAQRDQAAAAVAQAEESLRIRTDRFGEGLERTADVLTAEALLAEQRLTYTQALYQVLVSVFRLELLLERPLLAH